MEVKEQSDKIAGEFFEIMQQLKNAEQRLKLLARAGNAYRDTLGADQGVGHAALIHLETATTHTTHALDELVATCAAARSDAEREGGPFECPTAVVHRPSKPRIPVRAAA